VYGLHILYPKTNRERNGSIPQCEVAFYFVVLALWYKGYYARLSIGKNPQNGKEITIPACKAPKFKAGKALKDEVNR
jgi:hypothetical protein